MTGRSYTDDLALRIHDESVRFRREVRSSVLWAATAVTGAVVYGGLFTMMQQLQRGLPASSISPTVVLPPASGSLLTTAFSALLAVVLGVWFSPNAFRLAPSESPETIARELSTRQVATWIARLCVLLSLGVAAWAFVSSLNTTADAGVDLVHMVVPILVGLGLAYWAAAAEVRLGDIPEEKLAWAANVREAARLRGIVQEHPSPPLSGRARWSQRVIVFVAVPLFVFWLGLQFSPAPSGAALIARLFMAFAATIGAFVALSVLAYRLIGRQTWSALGLVLLLLLGGTVLWLTAGVSALSNATTADAVHVAPIARATLSTALVSVSGPFLILFVLAIDWRARAWRGLIVDRVMLRYERELVQLEEKLRDPADRPRRVARQRAERPPFAWPALAAWVPVAPFNFMFAELAIRLTRNGEMRGRGMALAAAVLGAVAFVGLVVLLVLAASNDVRLVPCAPDSSTVCLAP